MIEHDLIETGFDLGPTIRILRDLWKPQPKGKKTSQRLARGGGRVAFGVVKPSDDATGA